MDGRMNIAYACDDAYAMQAGVSMTSLLKNNHHIAEIKLYVLCCRVSDENKNRLSMVAERFGRELELVDVEEALKNYGMLDADPQQWSAAAYARLLIHEMLPDVKRILYLDCDTLVLGSLQELWTTTLNGKGCAMTTEPFSALHKKNLGMSSQDRYFNSGVMLIDLEKWRIMDMTPKFAAFISERFGRVPYVDQGCLNGVCRNDIVQLPLRFNVHTLIFDFTYDEIRIYRAEQSSYDLEEVESAKASPAVVHFTSSFITPRPWVEGSTHPYKDAWRENLADSPWAGMTLRKKKRDAKRDILRAVYLHSPRAFGIRVAALVNSYIRPLLKR